MEGVQVPKSKSNLITRFFDTVYGKIIIVIARIIVGGLFIFSGFIKLNDPLGFSFKLDEYFGSDVLNIEFLKPYALGIALFVVILEIVLGVMILLGYKKKFTLWSLLSLIVFFTFLTFYSAFFDKVKDCGCFGDFLKLTPWESFWKDMILLILILILFAGSKYIKPLFSNTINLGLTLVSLIACILFGRHVLNHLPTFDFRAYKIGTNIPQGMIVPNDAPRDLVEYTWTFKVNGEEQEIVTTSMNYPEVDGEYINVVPKIIKKGYEPPIHDFSIENNEAEDVKDEFLNKEKLIFVVVYDIEKVNEEGLGTIKEFADKAIANGYEIIGLTGTDLEEMDAIKSIFNFPFDFYWCDKIPLKTIVRSNPGIVQLNKGTIINKVHFNDRDKIQL